MARCDLFNCRILVWIFCFEPRHVEAWEGQELEQQEHQLKEQAACSSSMSHTWSNVNFRRKCFSRKLLNSSDGDHEVAAISGSYSLEDILRIASCWQASTWTLSVDVEGWQAEFVGWIAGFGGWIVGFEGWIAETGGCKVKSSCWSKFVRSKSFPVKTDIVSLSRSRSWSSCRDSESPLGV